MALLYPFDNKKIKEEKWSNLVRVTQLESGETNSDPSNLVPEPMYLSTITT